MLQISIPKATRVIAGRDIANLNFFGQNLNSTDLTLISAGRDFIDRTDAIGQTAQIEIGGPGRVDLLAGRNVDLGLSSGITTVGNLLNANLPTSRGADLTIMAGLGQSPDYTDFLNKIVAPDAYNQGQLIAFVEGLTGASNLSFDQALAQFTALSTDQRRDFLDQIFFHELLLSGQEANTVAGAGFTRGYAAIDTLFPNSRTPVAPAASPYSGNISLSFSRVYTLSGGTISLFAPGGGLDVGVANAPASLPAKQPYQLGIVAQGPGDVNVFTASDVLVNSSRIFTLGGGNILIWSDGLGGIDAGRGAKSSVSAPPPTVLVDSSGNITLNFGGAVAGSGIRTIQVSPSVPPGNVDLIAPVGTVNAGDAGIGASGNINIAAAHVLGLDNIQFGGTATGVPAQVSDIGVSLSGAANVASGASNTAASSTGEEARRNEAAASPLAQSAINWLEVFVTGLGEENCHADDTECLKRQKN